MGQKIVNIKDKKLDELWKSLIYLQQEYIEELVSDGYSKESDLQMAFGRILYEVMKEKKLFGNK